MTLAEQINIECSALKKQMNHISQTLEHLPHESFFIVKDDKRSKWYIYDATGKHYLPKHQRKKAEQLAYQKYLSAKLKELQSQYRILQDYLNLCNSNSADQMLSPDNRYAELLHPYFAPHFSNIEAMQQWNNSPYETNPYHKENLIHPTNLGFSVRSKSEAMIAMALYSNHIPFRYECALSLHGVTIYPDFTLLHPITEQVLYWEHFGLIDDPDYQAKHTAKMKRYMENGIYPSINLICSYETNSSPFSFGKIDQILRMHNLNT